MIEKDPRVTEGPGFFRSLYDWMRRVAVDLNAKAPIDSPALTGDPTAPTPPSTDNDSSIATTAWCKLGFAISAGANGYVKLPTWMGGFILQWGVSVLTAGGSLSVSFPLAFPSNARAGVASPAGGAPPSATAIGVRIDSASAMTLFNTSAGANTVYWIVVGT